MNCQERQGETTRCETPGVHLLVVLGLDDLATPIKAVGAHVVTKMSLARARLNGERRGRQKVVRTVHAPLGGRFLVLLDGHCWSPEKK